VWRRGATAAHARCGASPERVPYRRSKRPEIVDLTGQKRVPLLIDGEQVIHDSRRILQHLDHRYGAEGED
jgi:glutathione S-transferase